MTNIILSQDSLDLFKALVNDAPNWSGTPLFGGNVGSNSQRGNLTQLKKAGLVETFDDEGDAFVEFTEKGVGFADGLLGEKGHHLHLFY